MDFDGRSALITGAAQGIGRATALELAGRGASIALVDRNAAKATDVCREILDLGGRAITSETDVTNPAHVSEAVAATIAAFGRLDVLVNNAGGSGYVGVDQIDDYTLDVWDDTFELNFRAAVLCTRAAVPHMRRQGYGKIVNLSSIAAKGDFGPRGSAGARLAYASAKAGILGLTAQLARDLGPAGIYVNAVMPGITLTEPGAKVGTLYRQMPEEVQASMVARVPLGRHGRPEEIAKVIAFLASDDASFVTGAVIEATGGQ